jgi:hypothetical protein
MFLIIVYIVSVVAWGLVLLDMVRATYHSVKYKKEAPRLLVPLAIASLALVIESAYFLVANVVRYFIDPNAYVAFTQQDNLFIIKIGIAIAGVLMLFKLRSERKNIKK